MNKLLLTIYVFSLDETYDILLPVNLKMTEGEKWKMSKEIFESLRLLEKERGIPMDFMLEKIGAFRK